jgi:glycosyltransferase involved in cell wall biosynthesis
MIICFPHRPGSGGPGSFQTRFEKELLALGYKVEYKETNVFPDLIFVVGGTRYLGWLIRMKLKGVPILYRLDGISWLHRKKKVGLKTFLLAEFRNFLSKIIHAFIADAIVYQSFFVENWWNRSGISKRKNTCIIYNGLKISELHYAGSSFFKNKLVILEGNIDYSPYAIKLLNELAKMIGEQISIELYGNFEYPENRKTLEPEIKYHGFLPGDQVKVAMQGSIFLSLDIHPACPNTVIEAMASGTPVVAFDTGSLKELVPPEAGIIVSYGSDPWQLEFPDVVELVKAINQVREDYSHFSAYARRVAEERYSIEEMTRKYLEVINKLAIT